MARFLPCDREQAFLMPPSCVSGCRRTTSRGSCWRRSRRWICRRSMRLSRRRTRPAGAHPAMMVALLLYAYARGQRSSRVIERAARGHRLCVIARRRPITHDRPVSPAPRARRMAAPRAGPRAVRAGRSRGGRGAGGRWHGGGTPTPRRRRKRATTPSSSEEALAGGRPTSTPPRTSSSETGAATSCRRSSRPSNTNEYITWPTPPPARTSGRSEQRGPSSPSGAAGPVQLGGPTTGASSKCAGYIIAS